jgi:hypothetical protein
METENLTDKELAELTDYEAKSLPASLADCSPVGVSRKPRQAPACWSDVCSLKLDVISPTIADPNRPRRHYLWRPGAECLCSRADAHDLSGFARQTTRTGL